MPNIDWTASMQQTYEFYIVDPITWKNKQLIDTIENGTITRDLGEDTLGSASFDCSGILDECYIRTYLVIIQNGVKYRECLGTHLVQSPSTSFDGKRHVISMDGYTPLIELKNNCPPIGYSLLGGDNIIKRAYDLTIENMRAPVVYTEADKTLFSDFISNLEDTWFSFISDLIANANYAFNINAEGIVMFEPIPDVAALQPVYTFNDDNSSIMQASITDDADLYNIPNVVEVVYSKNSGYFYSKVVNDDINSQISTVNRGREIIHRDSNPSISGDPTEEYVEEYAVNLLKKLSCLEHTVTFTHAYCPIRLGDCIMLNYKAAGLNNVKARVTQQTISCSTGCLVETTATYTTKLWR